jgi:PAS domain S-box-containing protein
MSETPDPLFQTTIRNWVRYDLWDQVPVQICIIDRKFEIIEANRAFTEARGEWEGRSCHLVCKGREERCLHCGAAETFADGRIRVREERGPVVEGVQTHYLVRTVPIRPDGENGDGEIPYVIEMTTDITQMKALTKESASIRSWVRNELWDQVPVRICVIDSEYKIVEANRAFTTSYGIWADRHCYSVYKGRSEHCMRCNAAETFVDGQVRVHEEEGLTIDGRPTWYLVRVVPITRPDGSIPYVIEMSTDITPTKVLEGEKLEAERLAVVGQTVAGLAHGVKNLLMGLDGGMYMARSGIEKGDPERLANGWEVLEDAASRITFFVKEFLEFSKGRPATVALIDPNDPARQVVELFVESARLAGITLTAEIQEDIGPALMDAAGIHTSLTNLVSNAIDACETSEKEGGHVLLSTSEKDGVIAYRVSDDGAGMEYEVKKKIFTNFFSTKASGKGTGLGLLTTSKIVQEHGGKVSFETKEGEGSVFSLIFPRKRLPLPSDEGTVEECPLNREQK